jgi:CSLREA domain-containing protein
MHANRHHLTRHHSRALALVLNFSFLFVGSAIGKANDAPDVSVFESGRKALWVSKASDTADGMCDADCSLREAIAAAAPGDRIGFAPLFDKSAQTISLIHGELLLNKDLSIVGPVASLTISANRNSRVFHVSNAFVSIAKLKVSNGRVFGDSKGAGILNEGELWLSQCEVFSNRSSVEGSGGGVANMGRLSVSDCVFSLNGSGRGGAIFSNGELSVQRSVFDRNFATNGAAVFAGEAQMFGAVNISDSTFRNNLASGDGAGLYLQAARSSIRGSTIHHNYAGSRGAGIFFASSENYRALQLLNSTISSNTAGLKGGALYTDSSESGGAFAEITSCTIAFNDAPSGGGLFAGASQNGIAETMLRSTIVYRNTTENFRAEGFAKIRSQGFNLSDETSDTFLNQISDKLKSDPILWPLADNGGGTWTHALGKDSPAIDQGHSFELLSDQRGEKFARIIRMLRIPNPIGGDGADIGAFELQTTN